MVHTVFGLSETTKSAVPSSSRSPAVTTSSARASTSLSNDSSGAYNFAGSPVASTSKLVQTGGQTQAASAGKARPSQEGDNGSPVLFKKRRIDGDSFQSGSKPRKLNLQSSPKINDGEEDIRTVRGSDGIADTDSKGKAREDAYQRTSKRTASFYDEEAAGSDADEMDGKKRGIQVQPGESKKQARKRMLAELQAKSEALLAARQTLPVFWAKDAILKEVDARDTVIVLGETGSGKTTQIPQFLLSSDICRPQPRIAVTQPRRVAATSLARRVSEEVGCRLGGAVGYSVRFDDCSSPKTRLKYLTDGTLLQEILGDRLLENYDVVIIDEAHERTLRTDMILGFLKDIQRRRKEMSRSAEVGKDGQPVGPLKIIVMSATIDAEGFSRFFDDAKILYVQGRTHPVRTMYLDAPIADYIEGALRAIFEIHYGCPPGDVLVFLAGQDEIENLRSQLVNYLPTIDPKKQKILVCPLYARLTQAEQNKAFATAPEGTRKVILATNVAETSITISGIRYVIDTGLQKEKTYHAATGMDSLLLAQISKNSATQRAGRAGRERPGVCYRLYTENAYRDMRKALLPEIQRCSLAFALLHLLAYGQNDVTKFNYMDRPSDDAMAAALMELYGLGATGQDGQITDLGRRMASLPLEPRQAKVLLASFGHGCSSDIIDLLSLLGSADSLLAVPFHQREEAAAVRSKFIHRSGDHMMLLNILKSYEEVRESMKEPKEIRAWCQDHYFSMKILNGIRDARHQLVDRVQRLDAGLDCSLKAGDNDEPILLCLLEGLFTNTAIRMPDGSYRRTTGSMRIKVHPSSLLHGKRADAILFSELTYTSSIFARLVSSIPVIWLRTRLPGYFQHRDTAAA